MATATASKAAKPTVEGVQQETANTAELFKHGIRKMDIGKDKGGTFDTDVYNKLLDEEEIPHAVAVKLNKLNARVANALALAAEEAFPAMKKHGLDRATFSLPTVGRSRMDVVVDRSFQVPTMEKGADGKMTMGPRETRYGNVAVKHVSISAGGQEMKAIKNHLQKQALALFSKG